MTLKNIINELNAELEKVEDSKIVDTTFLDETDARLIFKDGYLLLTADGEIQNAKTKAVFPSKEAFKLIRSLVGMEVLGFEEKEKEILIRISDGTVMKIDASKPTDHEWIMVSAGGNSFAIA